MIRHHQQLAFAHARTAPVPLRTVLDESYHVWRLGVLGPEAAGGAEGLPYLLRALIIGGLSTLSWAVLAAAALAPWWLTGLALSAASAWL